MDAHSPRTTKIRLGAPLNADLFTTVRDVPTEKPSIASGDTMANELGPQFADSYVISVQDVPDRNRNQISITHFRRVKISDQHSRNFAITEGDVLVRTYVLLRNDYPSETSGDYKLGTPPEVGTTDDRFPRYGYTHETVMDSAFGLDPVFVVVQRFYQKIEKTRKYLDDELDHEVRETVKFIPKGSNSLTTSPGFEVELDESHTQYDVVTTRRLLPNDGDPTADGNLAFPVELPSLPTTINKRFPDLLLSVKLVSAYAFAVGGNDAPSYSEDFYFDPKIIHPFPGPHEGRILRFLTDDPSSILAQFPIVQWVEEADTIPLLAAWWSTINGNTTFALADQVSLPPCVHGRIPIEAIDTLAIVQQKTFLEPTPGFTNFAALHAGTVDHEPKKTRYGLYLVQIYQVNASGIYSGIRVPFDQEGGNTGAGQAVIDTTQPPEVYSGTPAADNLSISGKATAGAAITALRNNTEIGKAMSNPAGEYLITLTPPAFTDPVQVQIKARKSGVTSGALVITMRDLAPGRPIASLDSALAVLTGSSQPGATIRISMTPQAQVERAEVIGSITADGQVQAVFTSARTGDITVYADGVIGDSASTIAGRLRTALRQQGVIDDVYDITGSGAYITATKRPPLTYDDPTLNIAISNGSAAGLTDAPTSSEITQGLGNVTLTVPSNGNFGYTFDPPLPNGTLLTITASDLGGTSPALSLEASTTPPLIESAAFASGSYITIEGVVSWDGGPPSDGQVTVQAFQGDTLIGSATNDGSGNFEITLDDPLFSGEAITIRAVMTSSTNVGSPSWTIAAPNLALPAPEFRLSAGDYIGTAPDPDLVSPAVIEKLVVRYEPTGEEVEFEIFDSNNEFLFNFVDFSTNIGNQNGERYEVFFRYDLNPSGTAMLVDGPITFINSPVIPLPGALVGIALPSAATPAGGTVLRTNWPGAYWPGTDASLAPDGALTSTSIGLDAPGRAWDGSGYSPNTSFARAWSVVPFNYTCAVHLPANMPAGCTIQIKFPGQNIADIGPEPYDGPYYLGTGFAPYWKYTYRTKGQRLDTMGEDSLAIWGANATAHADGWYLRKNNPYTNDQLRASVPARLRIIVTAPDGRSSVTVWTRDESSPFNGYPFTPL